MKTIAFVTRVHPKRPNMLKICINSIKAQTSNDYVHILYRDDKTKNGYGRLRADQSLSKIHSINAQYIMILDDDDMLIDLNFVKMFSHAVNEVNPEVVIFKGIVSDRGTMPRCKANVWGKFVQRRQIASFCYAVRGDIWQKYIHEFGDKRNGDYKFIFACYENTKRHLWLNHVVARTQKGPGEGKGEREHK